MWANDRANAAERRFVPCGGAWAESDCGLLSGESLDRRLLYEQRFYERELGRRCAEFWYSDVSAIRGISLGFHNVPVFVIFSR